MNDYPNYFFDSQGSFIAHAGGHYSSNWTPEKQLSYSKWYYQQNKAAILKRRQLKRRAERTAKRGNKLNEQSKLYYEKANENMKKGDSVKDQQYSNLFKDTFNPKVSREERDKKFKRSDAEAQRYYSKANSQYERAAEKKEASRRMSKRFYKAEDEYLKKKHEITDDRNKLSNKLSYVAYSGGVLVRNIKGGLNEIGKKFTSKFSKDKVK